MSVNPSLPGRGRQRDMSRGRLMAMTLVPIAVILVVILAVNLATNTERAIALSKREMAGAVQTLSERFDGELRRVAQVAEQTGRAVTVLGELGEAQIYELLENGVLQDPLIYGAAMAYVAGGFEGRAAFCPYVYRNGIARDSLDRLDIANAYDYLNDPEVRWWADPVQSGRPVWSEPYYDEGAGNIMMSTYSVPFLDAGGRLLGVTTVDIPLSPLQDFVGTDLDVVVLTSEGHYIHRTGGIPDGNPTVFEHAVERPAMLALAQRMVTGDTGMAYVEDENGERQLAFFAPLPSAGWSFAVNLPEARALADARREAWWLAGIMLLTLGLIALAMWFVAGLVWRTQTELARQRLILTSIIDTIPDWIFVKDGEGRFLHVNPPVAEFMGRDREEIIGSTDHDLFDKEQADFFREMDQKVIDGGMSQTDEEWVTYPDSSRRLLETTKMPFRDSAGKVGGILGISRDITERHLALEALAEVEERQRLVLESAGEGIFGLDLEGRVSFCNRGAADMLGYGADELLGVSMHRTVHYAHADGTAYDADDCPMRAAFRDGETHHIDGEVLWRKDGTAFPVEYSATPISRAGELAGAVIVFRDIAARQAAEAALRGSERQFRTLVGNIPGVVYRCLPRHPWTMLFISDGVEVLTGYPASDFLGEKPRRTFGELMHPDDMERIASNTAEAVSKQHPYINEYRVIDAGGEIHWVYAKGQAVYGDDGEAEYLDGTIFDISDRLKAEDQLRQSEERLEAAASGANLGLWDFFPQRGEILANATWASMLGYEPGSIRETNDKWSRVVNGKDLWMQLVHPDDLEPTVELIRQHLEGQTEIYRAEYRMRCADGSWKWILDAGQVTERDDAGQALRMNGIHADIDEPKRLQAELEKAKEAADAANQAKSTFLANMSHELRTPMNAILGYSEMLMEEAEDTGQDDFIPDLKKINQAGAHLLSLINDVLDLSKIESGKLEIYAEVFDVGGLIDQITGTAQPLMAKNKNHFRIERGDHLGSACQDLTRLRQSLLNLLSNAAKFTRDGHVTLHVERAGMDGTDWLSFAVTDTGIGIAADKLEQVFEEFSQADNSTTRDYGGTGLGLTISRRFCQMLGGDMTVTSELGAGSTFTIRVPAVLPGAELPVEKSSPAGTEEVPAMPDIDATRRGSTVLVIDDDAEACEILRRFLEKDGFDVVTALSGEQGLRLAHQLQPAAITLDVMMPDMDGWSVLRALKADPVLHDIPVVMLTLVDDKSKGYALGATDYLTKPVDRNKLHSALARFHTLDESCSVLLVEDDQATREVMARTLEKAGWEVTEAGNGREALERLAEARPRLILLDLMMPVMDGFDFLIEMRANPGWQDIPVIVLTAKDLTDEDRRVLSGRVEQIVEKGASTHEQVANLVRHVMGLGKAT